MLDAELRCLTLRSLAQCTAALLLPLTSGWNLWLRDGHLDMTGQPARARAAALWTRYLPMRGGARQLAKYRVPRPCWHLAGTLLSMNSAWDEQEPPRLASPRLASHQPADCVPPCLHAAQEPQSHCHRQPFFFLDPPLPFCSASASSPSIPSTSLTFIYLLPLFSPSVSSATRRSLFARRISASFLEFVSVLNFHRFPYPGTPRFCARRHIHLCIDLGLRIQLLDIAKIFGQPK